MKTTLLIMAAGIGSRFGGGIKQLAPIDDNGHIIMDYSIHDAIEAGFNKVVFIIRRDIESDFKEVIGNRIEAICAVHGVEVDYVFQELDAIPESFTVPEGRTKPWGTGQAVLAAKDLVKEPFVVINADDYYGKEGFVKIHNFLVTNTSANALAMAGFLLKNTLSENGGVTRGLCQIDVEGHLTDVVETGNIIRIEEGAEANGERIDSNTIVSMNMWGMHPDFIQVLERGFDAFFNETVSSNPMKAEYLLPIYIGRLLREKEVTVLALETHDKWFGVTYADDRPLVIESFRGLIASGVYKEDLYSDL